jgi:hypothetical protein
MPPSKQLLVFFRSCHIDFLATSDEDEDSSSENDIPYSQAKTFKNNVAGEQSEDEDEGDEEEYVHEFKTNMSFRLTWKYALTLVGQSRYIVESIESHRWDPSIKQFIYQVKWYGFSDKTWELSSNLETASDVLKEYYDSIGGAPVLQENIAKKRGPKPGRKKRAFEEGVESGQSNTGARKRGRKRQSEDDDSDFAIVNVRIKKEKYPPGDDNWDKHIVSVDTIEELPNKMGTKDRWGLITWDNQQHSRHRIRILHQKAPQAVSYQLVTTFLIMTDFDTKMLNFYESNL